MPNSFATGILGQLMWRGVPETLSIGERTLLQRLIAEEDSEEGEQLTRFVPGGWMIDVDNVSAKVCFRLIRHCLISMDGEESGGVSYWRVNEMGREAAMNPDYVPWTPTQRKGE